VDEHSKPEEKRKLEQAVSSHPMISLYHSDQPQGKKQALKLAIEKSKYELILCTDADCTPAGHEWIKSMVEHSMGHDLVLGYSPYKRGGGLLNLMVRFETVMTGIQYLSWAVKGLSYMGVGRNMLYPRKLFLDSDPYKHHHGIPYGDDDLWVQQARELVEVNVSFEKASHVYSTPPATWLEWLRQKHRHLSAGHQYSNAYWWLPGIYGMALIAHWLLFPLFIPLATDSLMFTLFVIGLAIRWDTCRKWTKRLGDGDTALWYPLLEVAYALYLAGMGIFTAVAKKKTWN
jgi:cellulose synthase/poly-beta-1,6-N-acetylglucosamine synthase-like glycosyltransferase